MRLLMGGAGRETRAVPASTLLEREGELAAIGAALRSAHGGDGRLLLVEGHAGIGKSALVAEARRRAADSAMTVLGGRGSDLERGHSFGVVRQLFEPVLAQMSSVERDDLLGGAAA